MKREMISEKYDPKAIEGKWQQVWEKNRVFRAADPGEPGSEKPKYYCLCMFPYPSGSIHMGHVRNYSIGDIISRYKRMRGFNVLQPIGWDAFGLPAENAAIQRGVPPRDWTLQNIEQMKVELKAMGIAYDWEREIATCLPEYFRWEQKLFLEFLAKGLAYKKKGQVNWCLKCETVLANEQVQDGLCWRCDSKVEVKELSQWYLRITQYADQLLGGHAQLKEKWPDRVLEMQKHWIGQSEGARIQFALSGHDSRVEVFTTRPDTLFGVTFVTMSAFHPLAATLCVAPGATEQLEKIRHAVQVAQKGDTQKNGFATGSFAVHPCTGEKVPLWIGDFVVMDYGTGVVMGVPAHDERDFEFATKYRLPIRPVIIPSSGLSEPLAAAHTGEGVLQNSGQFTGLPNETAKGAITTFLQQAGKGAKTIQYKLRDWGISRQRYWGTPVPVIYCSDCGTVPVPEKDLPVVLPTDIQFKGVQGNPLEQHPTFAKANCPRCQKPARRETDTMDTFVESSWYYARYTSPQEKNGPFSKPLADYWLPVDRYIGGIEHACMHLLYSRFFHKVLRDWGYLSGNEPFSSLLSQGMVVKDGAKMSKSKGNVVAPTAILDKFGADTARLFSMFAAPPEKDLDWNEKGVEGCHRFLHRVWRLFYQYREDVVGFLANGGLGVAPTNLPEPLMVVRRKTHWCIEKMTSDLESDKFNTAVSSAMELVNAIYSLMEQNGAMLQTPAGKWIVREALQNLVLCLSPFAPHFSEELWQFLGGQGLASTHAWPTFQAELLAEDNFLLVVQVNGKLREKVEVAKNIDKAAVEKLVLGLPKVQQFMEGKPVKQFIYVPGRLANVVVG